MVGQYITDRQFPDKAIGIMDMSSSLTNWKIRSTIKSEELQTKIDEMNKEVDTQLKMLNLKRLRELEMKRIKVEKELAKLIEKQEKDVKSWPEVTIDNVSRLFQRYLVFC